MKRRAQILVAALTALLAAGAVTAEPVPLEVGLAEYAMRAGREETALAIAAPALATAEAPRWRERLAAAKAAGDGTAVVAQSERVRKATDLAVRNRTAEADQMLRATIRESAVPLERAEARRALLDLYWTKSDYKDADYLAAAAEFPDDGTLSDDGSVAYRSGLVRLRRDADAAEAFSLFSQAARAPGEFGARAAAMAHLAETMLGARAGTFDESGVRVRVREWMAATQGGAEKTTNPVTTAWYVLKYADAIRAESPTAAVALCNAVAADPVFGRRSAEAALKVAQWTGAGIAQAEARNAEEKAAQEILQAALAARDANDFGTALAHLDRLEASHASTASAADGRLRRGYVLLAAGRRAEAAEAFESALAKNAVLGESHPFNLEARYRLKQTRHADLYAARTRPFEDPTENADNIGRSNEVLDLAIAWSDALPPGSPDAGLALAEEAGALFEQAKFADSAEGWTQFREWTAGAVASTQSAKAGAMLDLMVLESHFEQDDFAKTVELSTSFPERHPGAWREIGTAKVFERCAWIQWQGDYERGNDAMRWVVSNVPADADCFPTANYHAIALLSLAGSARANGDVERYAELKRIAETLYPDDRNLRLQW